MKICPRYLTPKSPLSERGLTLTAFKALFYASSFIIDFATAADAPVPPRAFRMSA